MNTGSKCKPIPIASNPKLYNRNHVYCLAIIDSFLLTITVANSSHCIGPLDRVCALGAFWSLFNGIIWKLMCCCVAQAIWDICISVYERNLLIRLTSISRYLNTPPSHLSLLQKSNTTTAKMLMLGFQNAETNGWHHSDSVPVSIFCTQSMAFITEAKF